MPAVLRTVTATRYVTPLREGGSLPGLVEADDYGLYVVKFRGAGQGPKALVAELVAGELARAAGLPVPEIVFVELDPEMARSEPDPEIQDLIRASAGTNLGLDYLPGSIMFDPVAETLDPRLASAIVWLDAYLANVDRTPRNTNMLMWHKRIYLIDHGAALYYHHAGSDFPERSRDPFARIKDHVLLPAAASLPEMDEELAARLTPEVIEEIVEQVPDAWLAEGSSPTGAGEARAAYRRFLLHRLEPPRPFLEEALRARALHV